MKQYLIFFDKLSGDPANVEKSFKGRIIVEAEKQIDAVNQFLEWVKNQDKFQDSEKFYFEIGEIEHQL